MCSVVTAVRSVFEDPLSGRKTWERINIPPFIIAGVVCMVVESSQSQQVAVSHRPPEETSASESGRLKWDTLAC